jgi:uncharacterized sporulation protein YeaH/YhbH (DUF444 family)
MDISVSMSKSFNEERKKFFYFLKNFLGGCTEV